MRKTIWITLVFCLLTVLVVSVVMMLLEISEEITMEAASSRARGIPQEYFVQRADHAWAGINFDAIRAFFNNNDIVAHLFISGTTINYFVVQTNDNIFYLRHDIWKNPSRAGWIFLDYEADIENADQNWVIYGHNMRRNHKFHDIRRYRDSSFFENYKAIILTTPYAVYRFEVFSFYSASIEFEYTHTNFGSNEEWEEKLRLFAQ